MASSQILKPVLPHIVAKSRLLPDLKPFSHIVVKIRLLPDLKPILPHIVAKSGRKTKAERAKDR
jgi:hypothetical protein